MPAVETKDLSQDHFIVLDGYDFTDSVRSQGTDFGRTMLPANYLGQRTMQDVHGAFRYPLSLAGDATTANLIALEDFQRRDGAEVVLWTDAGPFPGRHASMGRMRTNGMPHSRETDAIATWEIELGAANHEQVITNPVGTLENRKAPGSVALTATGNGTAVLFAPAVTTEQEMFFCVHEPEFPGPTAGSTLVGVLESATDEIFTTPVVRITLPSIGDTRGSESDVLAGPLTAGLWWRVAWTVTGGSPERFPIAAFGPRTIG